MKIKLLEVRDRATFLPVIAISTLPANEGKGHLLRRSGYTLDIHCIILARLQGGKACYDPHEWGDRIMKAAHRYIEENFTSLRGYPMTLTAWYREHNPSPPKWIKSS